MDVVAKQYVNEANQLITHSTYLEYISYFKILKKTDFCQTKSREIHPQLINFIIDPKSPRSDV